MTQANGGKAGRLRHRQSSWVQTGEQRSGGMAQAFSPRGSIRHPMTPPNARAAYLTRILTSTCPCGCGHAIGERRQQNIKR